MKTLFPTLLVIVLVGCASAPSRQVRQAAENYQAVNRSMTRGEVYRILGEPQGRLPDGREQWRVVDGHDSAELLLRFGADGKITEMEKHYPMTPK